MFKVDADWQVIRCSSDILPTVLLGGDQASNHPRDVDDSAVPRHLRGHPGTQWKRSVITGNYIPWGKVQMRTGGPGLNLMRVMTRQLMPMVPHTQTLAMPAFRIYLKSLWDCWILNPDKPAASGKPFLIHSDNMGPLAAINHAREKIRPLLLRGDSGQQYLREVIPELGQTGFIPTIDNGPGRTLPKPIQNAPASSIITLRNSVTPSNCQPSHMSELTLNLARELSKIEWRQQMKPIVVVRVEHPDTERTLPLYHPTVSIQSAKTNQTATIHIVWEEWYGGTTEQERQDMSARIIREPVITGPIKSTERDGTAKDRKKLKLGSEDEVVVKLEPVDETAVKIEPEDMTMDQGIRGGEDDVGTEGVGPVKSEPSAATPMATGEVGLNPNKGRADEHPETTCKENQEAETARASLIHHVDCKHQLLM
jgi:hypothetical protein